VRNLLWDEWFELFGPIAAKWCADDGVNLDRNGGARWTCPLSGSTVYVELRGEVLAKQTPCCTIGPAIRAGDALLVRRGLRETIATIDKAAGALYEVDGVAVWMQDCPCDSCRGKGKSMGRPCERCNGTGKRQPEEVSGG